MDQVKSDVVSKMLKPITQGFLLQASVNPSLADYDDHVLVHQNFYDSFGDLCDLESIIGDDAQGKLCNPKI